MRTIDLIALCAVFMTAIGGFGLFFALLALFSALWVGAVGL
jgi:hypothetical protein